MAKPVKSLPPKPDANIVPYTKEEQALLAKYKARRKSPPKFGNGPEGITTQEKDENIAACKLYEATGFTDTDAMSRIASQLASAQSDSDSIQSVNSAIAMLHELEPQSPLEGLLSSQMVVTHNLAMNFAARATNKALDPDLIDRNVNRASKLMRLFATQAEVLHKLRNGGKQTVTVQHQHVSVNDGGQAVIGNVAPGGGG